MGLNVEIDGSSGFCGGVIRAIGKAEKYLDEADGRHLFSLGAIVHNEEELDRLSRKGLVAIDYDDLEEISGAEGETLLIRAHGEPPKTYELADTLGFKVIDCTCPVVLNLQKSIRDAYSRLHPEGGKLIIFGKIGHAEVLGLVGQVDGDALVVENLEMLQDAISRGEVDVNLPVEVFSQTTKSPSEYDGLCNYLASVVREGKLLVHDTICSQVATRHEKLSQFALNHDVIVFVSGNASSNGKVLCEWCRSVNIRTYHIGSVSEIKKEWFRESDRVGVCGATSTPRWLLEKVASALEAM
ncbi:MAG: 4-hydroxy-3-methylbut-2-enyl diphosphate reductase [Bacteroidia bacterium]|nr:4-hydroxy-3-methylbut-2-enyl diphosphate reductase [Bacteroidia bacterium]